MVVVNSYDAITADHLLTRLTEEVQLFVWVLGALQALLDWRHKIGDISCQLVEGDYLVRGKLFPLRVEVFASLADKATRAAVAGRLSLLALVALNFGWSAHLFEGVSWISKQVVHEEGASKAGDSVLGERGGMATVRALHNLSLWGLACQDTSGSSHRRRGSTGVAWGPCRALDIPHRSTGPLASGELVGWN